MKVLYPGKVAIDWRERLIKTNIARHFLSIFRDTQDIHRVLVIIPLVLLLSHGWFMQEAPQVSLVVARLSRDETILLSLVGFVVAFVFCWAVFSAPVNIFLYVRQAIVGAWALIIHRLLYGLTELGTADFYLLAFVSFASFLPFALTGLKIEKFFQKIQDERAQKRDQRPAVVEETEESAA